MKHCPGCHAQYDDTWSVCLTDGTKLLDGGAEPTSTAPSQNASRWRRYGTWVVDSILHSIILFILYGVIIGLSVKMGAVPKKILTNKWLIYPLSYTTYVFYYIVCEGFFKTTPGKRFCGTRIIRVWPDGIPDAAPISFTQVIIRTLCRAIPFEPFSVLFRSSRLGWHDTIAGTAVINAEIKNKSSFFDRFFTLSIVVAVPALLFLLFQQELSVSTSVSQSLWVEGRLRVVEAPDISEAERTRLRDTVRELGLQLAQLPRSEPWQPWRASKKVVTNQVLIVLLNNIVRDNKLTREEYDQWMAWYSTRDTLDALALLRARNSPKTERPPVPAQSGVEAAPEMQACGESDIVGAWTLIDLKTKLKVPEGDPDFMPNQIWVFTPGGKFVKMGQLQPFTKKDYEMLPTVSNDKLLSTTYKVIREKGALLLYPKDAPRPYLFSCFVVPKNYMNLKAGDILLDLRTADGTDIVIGHQFRKLDTDA